MDEVEGDLDAVERGCERLRLRYVALNDRGVCGERGTARVAHEAAHVEPAPQQIGREAAADVARGAGDQDARHVLATRRMGPRDEPGRWRRPYRSPWLHRRWQMD
jgi:hypothetical protein